MLFIHAAVGPYGGDVYFYEIDTTPYALTQYQGHVGYQGNWNTSCIGRWLTAYCACVSRLYTSALVSSDVFMDTFPPHQRSRKRHFHAYLIRAPQSIDSLNSRGFTD